MGEMSFLMDKGYRKKLENTLGIKNRPYRSAQNNAHGCTNGNDSCGEKLAIPCVWF